MDVFKTPAPAPPPPATADQKDIQALEKLKSMRSAGVRLYGGRTADEIDAMIDEIRGDK